MEDFVVSARKYRPQDFDAVVGQESITQTLLKSIKSNHLAQAFLFCGPRGVGKTTCARILAKTVNDLGHDDEGSDHDYSFNIFELDAASNNSVDDIRSLIDQVRIPPQVGKYKVYIIDEVHMLSSSAFNAFLKTLEEPPPYAIFILATTEKHKVLPTILSRCQIFDFNRIQIPDMVNHLQGIAEKESIEVDNDALHVIAEKADGALRDALSIFDQIVGFSGNKISYEDVISNLNVLDYDYYFKLTDAFLKSDHAEVIVIFNNILEKGFDGHSFVNGLANHFRNLLFCTSDKTAAILEVGQNVREQYLEQSKLSPDSFILNAMNILSAADVNYKASKNPRLLVEIALLKICSLIGKIEQKKNGNDQVAASKSQPSAYQEKGEKKSEQALNEVSEPKSTGKKDNAKQSDEATEIAILQPEKQKSEEKPEIQSEPPVRDDEKVNEFADQGEPEQPIQIKNQVEKESQNKTDRPSFKSKLSSLKTKGIPTLSQLGCTGKTSEISAQEEDELVDDLSPLDNKPADSFNQAHLWKAWDEYAERIKQADKQSYYATLTKHKAILREDFKLEFLVDNHVQLQDLNIDKANLVGFLREKLNNWRIVLKVIIDEVERDDGDSLYDPQKKFEAMAERNSALIDLRKRFDLDVDYDA